MNAGRVLGFGAAAMLLTYVLASVVFQDPAEEPRKSLQTDSDSASVVDTIATDSANVSPAVNEETNIEPGNSPELTNEKPGIKVSKTSPKKTGSSSPPPKQSKAWVDSVGRPVAISLEDETLRQPPSSDGDQPTHIVQKFQVGEFTKIELHGLEWLNEELQKDPNFAGISLETEQQSRRVKILSSKDQSVLCEIWLTPTTANFRWAFVADETLRRCQNRIRLAVVELRGSGDRSQMVALHPVTVISGIALDLQAGGEIPVQSIPLAGEFAYPIHFSGGKLEVTNVGSFAIQPVGKSSQLVSLPQLAQKLGFDTVFLTIQDRNMKLQFSPSPETLAEETKGMEVELKDLEKQLAETASKSAGIKRKQQAIARLAELLKIKPISVDDYVKDGNLDETAFANAIRDRTKNILTKSQSRKQELTRLLKTAKPKLSRAESGWKTLLGSQLKLRAAVSRVIDGICVDLIRPQMAFRQDSN